MANNNSKGYDVFPTRPLFGQGVRQQVVHAIADVQSTDADGDTYVLARNLPIDTIVSRIVLPKGSAGITGATDYDIGFYKSDGTGLGDALGGGNTLVNAKDFSAAINAGEDINEADSTKTIGELLSLNTDQEYVGGVHVVLTLNTAGSETQDLDFDIVLSPAG